MPTPLHEFLAECDAGAARLGLKRSQLSARLLKDSRRLDLVASGKDIGVRRMERATQDLRLLIEEKQRSCVGAPS
jgi:hypothetical protein